MIPFKSPTGRSATDYFPTPHKVTKAILPLLTFPALNVWEPCAGEGNISKVLDDRGLTVINSDYYRYPNSPSNLIQEDFNQVVIPRAPFLITNPPFCLIRPSNQQEGFVMKCLRWLKEGKLRAACLLLKAVYFNTKHGAIAFDSLTPSLICPLIGRPRFKENLGKSPMLDVQWVLWQSPSYLKAQQPQFRPLHHL